ncbi:MAG: nucleotide exchange factor GrpE [Phycisphaerales bacterium]|jgi:molecular chaperone GrpE|nr:nucleotide exchange factor GrpE [Phycisphaerales bacterium]MBT7171950.1 nucleotide exchange factor GrpE [Phycisphaerales bacterium]
MTDEPKNPDPELTDDAIVEAPIEELTEPAEPQTPEEQYAELNDRFLRLAADYQNYKKRIQKDIQHARDFANEALMKNLLTVLDDMERAMAQAASENHDEDPFYQGMKLVHDNLLATLGQHGLTEIEAAGQPFDPQLHAALMQQPTSDVDPMIVLDVLQRGFTLKGRAIRPAQVIVSKEPDAEEATDADV